MAEKLGEGTWTAFAKKRDLDDSTLVKALARFDKTDLAKPQARLEALDDCLVQLNKQLQAVTKRKKELGDKPYKEVRDKLDGLIDDATRLQKEARAAVATAEAKARDKATEDADEADSPALLTTKMIPLLRELRKPGVQMHALVAVGGKSCAVLIMRRAISPARRKVLAEHLAVGGLKYAMAECFLENNALTFVVQTQAAGLARKLRAALLEQTGLRQKVRVRGEDGESDDDGEQDGPAPTDEATASGTAAPAQVPEAPAAAAPGAAAAPDAAAPAVAASVSAATAFTARLTALMPAIKGATEHPAAAAIRQKSAEAGLLARQRDWPAAQQCLDDIESLLEARGPAAPAAAPAPASPGGAATLAPAVYQQTQLAWSATRNKLRTELQKLETAILEHYRGHRDLAVVTQSVRQLDGLLERFDSALSDQLQAAMTATDPLDKQHWHDQARAQIARYRQMLASDPLVKELDSNPFVPITVQVTLDKTLSTLAAKIA